MFDFQILTRCLFQVNPLWRITEYSWYTYLASTGLGIHIWPKQRLQIIKIRSTDYPKKYTITHIAGGAMLKYFTSTSSSSCSVPIWTSIFGTEKQQKQNNQFISNQLRQTNIVLSKINFKCELLCSYCLHKFIESNGDDRIEVEQCHVPFL